MNNINSGLLVSVLLFGYFTVFDCCFGCYGLVCLVVICLTCFVYCRVAQGCAWVLLFILFVGCWYVAPNVMFFGYFIACWVG